MKSISLDEQQLKPIVHEVINEVIEQMRFGPIRVGVSNRHVHLSQQDYQLLFPNIPLKSKKTLYQPGQYAAEQTVSLEGPKGRIDNVRILGPLRSRSQVEISRTDARNLGINAPLRMSGDLDDSAPVRLISPYAEIELTQGVIVAQRHIHMSPLDALIHQVKQGDKIKVSVKGGNREMVFDDVVIRISETMKLEFHIDTDEANAADISNPNAVVTRVWP